MPTKAEITARYTAMGYDPALDHSPEATHERWVNYMAELEHAEPSRREKRDAERAARDAEHAARKAEWKAKGGGRRWGNSQRHLFEAMNGQIVIQCRLCPNHRQARTATDAEALDWWDAHAATAEHQDEVRTRSLIDVLAKGLVDAEQVPSPVRR